MKRLQNTIKTQNKGTLYTHTHTQVISEKQNQTGRSMVEMLGVLAVIGVLSIVGIAGFRTAMDKHAANTIIQEAHKRAVVVAGQVILAGGTPSLAEFTNNNLDSATFDTKVYTKTDNLPDGQFGIKVSGVSKDVCQNILNTIGNDTIIRRLATTGTPATAITACGEDNAFLMVYNNDMSKDNIASNQPIVDTSIDNAEDCSAAGKKWCIPFGEDWDSSSGFCSNVSDCCKGVPVGNCQTCQSSSMGYAVVNKLQGIECDYNGDGNMNDGVCLPASPTDNSCENDSLELMCLNHVQYAASETFTCIPAPCSLLGTCCSTYSNEGMNALFGQAQEALLDEDLVTLAAVADQANTVQCTTCNSSTGATSSVTDGTLCQYADVEYFVNRQSFLAGTCQSGKCAKSEGFLGYGVWTGSYSDISWDTQEWYSCSDSREIVTADTDGACKDLCLNRKMTQLDNDGAGICSLNCPSGTYALAPGQNDDCAFCGNPKDVYLPRNSSDCLACGNRHVDGNGKCVMDHCPTGYFRGQFICIPCDEQEDTNYEYTSRYWVSSKADCDKCANDGAHARTYYDNGMCRY